MTTSSVRPSRRQLLQGMAVGAGGLLLPGLGRPAFAAGEFPSETINIVTHAGPGGGTDITTRMMMLRARKEFGQDLVVVNKRGGSGSAALMYTNSQPRDGYTVMTITQSHIFQIIQKKVPITIDQLVGVARATDDPTVIAVPASSKLKTLEDLIAASKDAKGGLKWGTTFAGGADHIGIHNFAKAAGGIPYTIVPFKGGGEIVTNLVGGNVDVALLNYAEGESQFTAGDIRGVVSLSEEPIAALNGVPTARDRGVDALASTVRGFAVLSGVPEDRLARLETGMIKAMKHSIYQNYLTSGGMPTSSVAGREVWNKQIRKIYEESTTALTELGML
ncbi:tripartite tricarboxylate transporter substrate binding protein [Thalassobaculum sp.]|uniref:Bug family tripartite tricarboxylate transporter substrate binding protein n=1 Tax=Thalassobaculum sp. TaxID=2022740 RepID=UPI0032EAAD10